MQLLLEFLPLAAFLIAYKLEGIYTATAVLMGAMVASFAISWLRTRKVPPMLGISTALVLVFGAATLILRDVRFIQWKPSILMWLLAAAFFASAFIGRQPLAQRMLQAATGDAQLVRGDWLKLNFAWVLFGLIVGTANIVVAYQASESTWVNVKTWGLPGATFVFILAQVFWLQSRARAQQ